MKKQSYITVTDQFCGAGGSSQGVRNLNRKLGGGIEVRLAMNHWKLAIETHNTNFPETAHDCTDISAADPRRYQSTDILITSPECTTHSPAGGNKHKKSTAQMELYSSGMIDPATERSRATMWDVCRFAEYHHYNAIIVENVVEAKLRWPLFEVWLKAMHTLGYRHQIKYLNSMHFWPTPQSRDRMYVVFTKKSNPKPNLDHMPLAYCTKCNKDINSMQHWKNPEKKFGKYRSQYNYVCPTDGTTVEPYYYAAFNAIDWTDIGKKIGDRAKVLSPNTMRRIQYGLDKYAQQPLIVNTRQHSGLECRVKPSMEAPIGTQVCELSHSLATPFVVKGEHTAIEKGYVRGINQSLMTQTVRQTSSLIIPWIIEGKIKCNLEALSLIVENKGKSMSKPSTKPFGAQTTNISHGIVSDEAMKSFLSYYYGTSQASGINESLGTMTTKERMSLVTYQKPDINDCYYRMIKPPEVKRSMAFDEDYIILGNAKDQVKQCGNAVTPPAMEWLVERTINSLK